MPSDPARILAVCTGNICRSPAVELLLRAGLARGDGRAAPAVASAGTGAVVGAPVHPPMAVLLAADGVEPDGFRARVLTADEIRRADLVLALTRRHRSAVVELVPAAVRRTFTLRELARIVGGLSSDELAGLGTGSSDRVRALVPLAGTRRGLARPGVPDADDVVDPYGRRASVYRRAYDQLAPAVGALVAALATAGPR